MAKISIFIGFRLSDMVFEAATTRAGLAERIGVSTRRVSLALDGPGFLIEGKTVWVLANVNVAKIERGKGKGGKAGVWSGGFRGMKGKEGLLEGPEAGRKLV